MEKDIVVSITLHGKVENEITWLDWYEYAKKIISQLGYNPNYISIESNSMKSGKVLKLKSKEKKIINLINSGENIEWLSIYSLPDEYDSAAFDYNMIATRNSNYLSVIVNKNDYVKLNVEDTINDLKKFIEFRNGEIYEMHRDESPLLYAAGLNEISEFDTLKIIKKIE
ncbi:hypothetical protein [Clostridium estertheticum]|uniref:hypothetical protein n=1 Tax=Clostridium estertheticum TaxID=238834 RepID=UPI001CF3133D|nr:hypothetical protein [Clostridium estertheticum]MCB2355762.1 hypothetical protein [Clostridium estertheticum]WAG39348.1 hypothetical protein LL065_13660 [Clostridium estertheticum]